LESVYQESFDLVCRLLRSMGVARSDLEDEATEVFLIVERQLATFRGDSTLETWIIGICRNRVRAYRRRAFRWREDLRREVPETAVPPSHDEDAQVKRYIDFLQSVLGSIDEDRRLAFCLYNLEEWSVPRIAELLGWPRQTTYDRLEAVQRQVAVAFARRFPSGRSS
jgi:RNA polymerase sigma-70 factor (ECF subfamily)